MNSTKKSTSRDIVISGWGLLNATGFGRDEIWLKCNQGAASKERRLVGFPVGNHLSDRKLMKAISIADAYGLAAAEQAVKDAGLKKGSIDPWSIGMYVGAPPSRVSDNDNYRECLEETQLESGVFSPVRFGSTMQRAKPTTLLQGLPNNVLCYGAIVSDLRGPNSNYTSGEVSGLMALIQGAARIKRDQLAAALVGGYQAQVDPMTMEIYRQNGWGVTESADILPFQGSGTLIGDGAAFLAIESREHAKSRGATARLRYLGGKIFCDASGFACLTEGGAAPELYQKRTAGIVAAIDQVCQEADVKSSEIGAVFPSASGIACIDAPELAALEQFFADAETLPTIAGTTRVWGHLMEAAGIADIILAERLAASAEIPESFRVLPQQLNQSGFSGRWDSEKKVFAVLQGTPTGESAFVLMQLELP